MHIFRSSFLSLCGAYLFDVTERSLGALCLWDDPPPSLHAPPVVPSSAQTPSTPPSDAPSPPGGEGVGRTEGHPHLGLLDHIQVLPGDSDDTPSTAEEEQNNITFKLRSKVNNNNDSSLLTFLEHKHFY